MSDIYISHFGVKGMRWGHRKAQPSLTKSDARKKLDDAKAEYKSAKKAYNKSFNKAYDYSSSHVISQWTNKKKSAEADKRWDDAYEKADAYDKAKSNYKAAKKERKQLIEKQHAELNKNTTLADRLIYNDATRKKAAKYMVDNNMSVTEATKKAQGAARRNTALVLAAYGAVTVASLYKNR